MLTERERWLFRAGYVEGFNHGCSVQSKAETINRFADDYLAAPFLRDPAWTNAHALADDAPQDNEGDVLYEWRARLLERETRIEHLEWLLGLAIKHVRKHEKSAYEPGVVRVARDLRDEIDEALGHD